MFFHVWVKIVTMCTGRTRAQSRDVFSPSKPASDPDFHEVCSYTMALTTRSAEGSLAPSFNYLELIIFLNDFQLRVCTFHLHKCRIVHGPIAMFAIISKNVTVLYIYVLHKYTHLNNMEWAECAAVVQPLISSPPCKEMCVV